MEVMMEFDRHQLEMALAYAEFAEISAKLMPDGQIQFERSALPEGLEPELIEEINFVADYYQRSVFNGDLESDELDATVPGFDDPLEELNFKLKRYQGEFVTELKKTLGIADHRSINPFARAMLLYSAEQGNDPKKK
ncbi:MAG: hypothetical protein RRB13_12615 [bacterium]|nr:hypothetical protein [bacterium]